MSVEALHVLVGTALTDERFKEDLLENPLRVIDRFDLFEEEIELVLQAATLGPCFGGGLKGFARVLANSEIVKEEFPFSL